MRVDDRLLEGDAAERGERALKLLTARLVAITIVVPEPALAKLRAVTIELDRFEIGRFVVAIQLGHLTLSQDRSLPLAHREARLLHLDIDIEDAGEASKLSKELSRTFATNFEQDVVRGGSPRARCGGVFIHFVVVAFGAPCNPVDDRAAVGKSGPSFLFGELQVPFASVQRELQCVLSVVRNVLNANP